VQAPVVREERRVSIHAPRAGSDNLREGVMSCRSEFQSTLPARGATVIFRFRSVCNSVSIHAPRAGSDRAQESGSSPY